MADIFISYSKADRLLVEQLAAYLESEGWSVWFDRALTAGDGYRDEIMKALVAARAVIVLWTPTSIRSDFVRAEAGQAKANAKLIPVKTKDVGYSDIPLPFGEMHTEPLDNRELIRAAVVGHLSKPQVEATGLRLAAAEVRYAALTWFGIFGTATTLLASLRGIISLSAIANAFVESWINWSLAIWKLAIAWSGLDISPRWAVLLTFFVSVTAITVGTRLATSRALVKLDGTTYESSLSWPQALKITAASILFANLTPLLLQLGEYFDIDELPDAVETILYAGVPFLTNYWTTFLFASCFTLALTPHKLPTLIWLSLYAGFFLILAIWPIERIILSNRNFSSWEFSFGQSLALFLTIYGWALFPPLFLAMVSAHALARKYIFAFVGLAILIVLNELSKLDVEQLVNFAKTRLTSM